ncbi:Cd(II)/Pb(II)-responsive transcriptional regulator [Alcaligenaceae bacterium CGII-47]|nr:Cd(II)/Pb(II)-responsive transcriptional regulator [Alcaligenaceae bacterium CGII-47]
MRIGELSKLTNVDIETIRYYERIGLLPEAPRSENGYRNYGTPSVERLAFIRHCRALDMPLAETQRILAFADHPQTDCGDIDSLIDTQLDRVRARLQSMQALEQQLTVLRSRCGSVQHSEGECGILHELVAAAHGEACVCHDGSSHLVV